MYKKSSVLMILLLISVLLLSACGSAEKLTEYDFGTDKIPSVNTVLGKELKVTGVDVGTSDGVQYKQYTYETTSMVEDLAEYTTFLRNNGWLVLTDYNFYDGSGEAQLGIDSADNGKILIISIAFQNDRYAIRVNKLEGSLSYN